MKASVEWLKDYSDIDVDVKELGDILTLTGTKVETIDSKGHNIKNVVIGKILSVEKHPDSDHLVICQVDLGKEKVQIVTGAPNVKALDIVVVAKDGSELPGNVKIKKGMLRGVESYGMMCSCGELDIPVTRFPNQIENGLMILPKEMEKHLGEDVVDVLNLKEDIIDFEITPNRTDCFSIEGIGRETAVSLNKKFKDPHKNLYEMKVENKDNIEGLSVKITAPDLCYRYIARVVKNVKIGESPDWMKRRLEACGIRSINNIVDITNYVMLELGQPMHAFDINSIAGKKIIVRRAKNGEKITTLDEQERALDDSMLVIADEKKPVAIAGVMGGLNSEIENTTSTVVFESAVFNGGNVRKTAKKVGLRTEASSRYEKGLPAENAIRAINRAVELVVEIGAGEEVKGKVDVYPTKQDIPEVKLDVKKINNLLGLDVSEKEIIKILEKLEMKVENNKVIPPYFRTDINYVADLAEEVARFYGYDKIPNTLIEAGTTLGIRTKLQKVQDKIKEALVNKGLSEIYTYGFYNISELDKCNISKNSLLRKETINIRNPLSEDYSVMRTTTLPSMMEALSINNSKKNKTALLFDISRVYKNVDGQIEKGENPNEEFIITLGCYGEEMDFYVLKGIVETVLKVASVQRYELIAEKSLPSYHPGKTAKICIGKDVIAVFGEIHPEVCENYDISKKTYIAEIALEKLVKYGRTAKKYEEVPKYPAVERDIALLIGEEIEVAEIEKAIQRKGKKIIEEIELFDVYRDSKLGNKKKSVAYSLKFRAKDRTLNEEEINEIMNGIIAELERAFGAELRK